MTSVVTYRILVVPVKEELWKTEPNDIVDSFVLDPKVLLRCVSSVQNGRAEKWCDIALFPCFREGLE